MYEEEAQMMENNSIQHRMNMDQRAAEQQALEIEQQTQGIVKEQLDLREEIERIDHLLRGHIQKRDKYDRIIWVKPEYNDDVILTEAGINLVLNTIQWYLNKNTLLSNYDDDTIRLKMKNFATTLADTIFMNYQKYFLYPTAKECQDKLRERLNKKLQDEIYSAELRGEEIDKEEIWRNLVNEIYPAVERKKIREQIIKDKLKLFDLLMREIQDAVHSTYNRAYGGQERKTLRQHIHVSESITPSNQPKHHQTDSGSGWFKLRR